MIPKQQTFDTVVAHLRKQGQKSTDSLGGCYYRSQEGLKCAVGCLIPDEKYDPSLEGCQITGISNEEKRFNFINALNYVKLGEILKGHDLSLLSDLQTIHDCDEVLHWEIYFKRVAKEHGLVYTPTNV